MLNINFPLELDFGMLKSYGVIDEAGKCIRYWGFTDRMEMLNWIDDDELQKISDAREPYDSPSCPYYTPQPDKLGKLIWLSGIVFETI